MALYSLRSPNTITKFDSDGNVESTYTCGGHTCDCPAGHRPTCRHRQMYPDLLGIRDTHWFLDWDHGRTIVDFSGIPRAHYDSMTCDEPERKALELAEKDTIPTSPPRPSWRRI